MAGTNDINSNDNDANAPARLTALMDKILAACPDAVLLVAGLIFNANADAENRTVTFNDEVERQTNFRADQGHKIMFVDMSAVIPEDLSDGLNPNDDGYSQIALAWDYHIRLANSWGWIGPPNQGAQPPVPPATSKVVAPAPTSSNQVAQPPVPKSSNQVAQPPVPATSKA